MSKSCPNCSATLAGHSCKLRCPRCHYFESCSDLEAYPSEPSDRDGTGGIVRAQDMRESTTEARVDSRRG